LDDESFIETISHRPFSKESGPMDHPVGGSNGFQNHARRDGLFPVSRLSGHEHHFEIPESLRRPGIETLLLIHAISQPGRYLE
jgi:hypothetical protein